MDAPGMDASGCKCMQVDTGFCRWIHLHPLASTRIHLHPFASTCIHLHGLASTCIHLHPGASQCLPKDAPTPSTPSTPSTLPVALQIVYFSHSGPPRASPRSSNAFWAFICMDLHGPTWTWTWGAPTQLFIAFWASQGLPERSNAAISRIPGLPGPLPGPVKGS